MILLNKYKKLVNNSIILTFGSFGSKLITFFMVPLYTTFLTTQEYGTVDLIITTRNLLLPIITLELGQAALRFAIDTNSNNKDTRIFSNIVHHGVLITVLLLVTLPILYYFNVFGNQTLYFIIILILSSFNTMFTQLIRGMGLVKEFAINGIIMTVVTVLSNLLFLVVLGMGVKGYLISIVISYFISNVFILYSYNKKNNLREYNPDKHLLKDMLSFSIPIIPNSTIWWLINGSTRYFILFFVGTSANGLFAVANKIPSVISLVTGIFSQAWQLSSFEEYKSKDKNEFYSTVFNIYSVLLFITVSMILVVLIPIMEVYVNSNYFLSWRIVPALLIGVIYQSFSAFLGTNYTASKQTKGTFTTSIYGGVISLVTNFIMVPLFGVIGGGISTAISFIGMFIIRLYDTRKFVKININVKKFTANNFILLFQILILYIFTGYIIIGLQLILFISIVFVNKQEINYLLKAFLNLIKKN